MMLWMIIIIKREEKSYCKWFRNDQMWMYSETESNLDCHNISLSEYFIRNCSILGGIILTRVTFSDQIHWSSIIIFIVKKKKRKSVADSIQNGVQSLKSPTNQIDSINDRVLIRKKQDKSVSVSDRWEGSSLTIAIEIRLFHLDCSFFRSFHSSSRTSMNFDHPFLILDWFFQYDSSFSFWLFSQFSYLVFLYFSNPFLHY